MTHATLNNTLKSMDEIVYHDRYLDKPCVEKVYGDKALRCTYETVGGKAALAAVVKRAWFSRWYGWRMDQPKTHDKIAPFIREYGLDASEFALRPEEFASFNEFFSRAQTHRTTNRRVAFECRVSRRWTSPLCSRFIALRRPVRQRADVRSGNIAGGSRIGTRLWGRQSPVIATLSGRLSPFPLSQRWLSRCGAADQRPALLGQSDRVVPEYSDFGQQQTCRHGAADRVFGKRVAVGNRCHLCRQYLPDVPRGRPRFQGRRERLLPLRRFVDDHHF